MIPNRRQLIKGALATAAIGFPMINIGRYAVAGATEPTYSARAVALVERSLVIDMLAVPRIDLTSAGYTVPLSEAEIAEFRASGLTAMHNAVGVGTRDDALTFLASQEGFAARHPQLFTLVDEAEDLDRAKADRKIAMIMGFQSAAPFATRRGCRILPRPRPALRPAHLQQPELDRIGQHRPRRRRRQHASAQSIVQAMNAAGMLIDVSHCGDRTTLDAIALSAGPIAITHSNCRALNRHPRNKTDEAIRACAAKGGVMGITGVRNFVRGSDPTNVGHMVDHVEHVARLVGIEHVGIGSDADLHGYDDMPPDQYEQLKGAYDASYAFRGKIDTDGFDHPRKIFDLTEELIRRRHSDADIALILGGNFRRLLGVAWTRPVRPQQPGQGETRG